MIRLPRCIYVTDRLRLARLRPEATLLDTIERALLAGVGGVYLREKDLGSPCYENLAMRVDALCRAAGAQLILPALPNLALAQPNALFQEGFGAISLELLRTKVTNRLLGGISCHSIPDLQEVQKRGASYAFLSPIFPTESKPGCAPLGLDGLAAACQTFDLPIVALGGIGSQEQVEAVRKAGAYGFAAIGLFQGEAPPTRHLLRSFQDLPEGPLLR